jgi:hypothetical protein
VLFVGEVALLAIKLGRLRSRKAKAYTHHI